VKPKRRVAILISGRGSNMSALIEAARDPAFPAEIVLVLANRPDAEGLAAARAENLTTALVDHRQFRDDREAFERSVDAHLVANHVEIVCLAGFMRVLTDWFVAKWQGRLINIHPSLLPAFQGLDTHRRALAAGVRLHGCTAHFVVPELDSGPAIIQAAVPVLPGDDEAALAARVLAQEHAIYPAALRLVAEGRVRLVDGKVVIADDVKTAALAVMTG
jgi:phosphoribosylglycinamide formyltransferase-1